MPDVLCFSLWNVGLTEETLKLLASFLPSCANVRTLFLEGNTPPIISENYHLLLSEDSQLVNLSLRHNGITDTAVENIAKVNTVVLRC